MISLLKDTVQGIDLRKASAARAPAVICIWAQRELGPNILDHLLIQLSLPGLLSPYFSQFTNLRRQSKNVNIMKGFGLGLMPLM